MELQKPGMQMFADPGLFKVVVSAHGLAMILFVIMPALIGGFCNWFEPIMISAPDMVFPRLNNVLCWPMVASLILFAGSMFVPGAPGIAGLHNALHKRDVALERLRHVLIATPPVQPP